MIRWYLHLRIYEPKTDGYVSQDLFLARGREATESGASSDFKSALIALSQKRIAQQLV